MVQSNSSVQTVLCLKWGKRYHSDYVNTLYAMVKRNTERPLRFVCITDDPTGIVPGVEIKPMPEFDLPPVFRSHPFRRMFIFDKTLFDLEGNVLHFDLDLVVTSSIDPLFDYKPESTFCVAENWTQFGQGIGNMSVFRFRVGTHDYIYKMFRDDPLAQREKYLNSQTFVSKNIKELTYYPRGWCLSFKHSLVPTWPLNYFLTPKLPKDCIAVAFTGRPDIDQAARGEWPAKGIHRLRKYIRPSPWIMDHWRA